MKLLFAEDEKMTRDGIRKSIAWEQLGITELIEAVDGFEAVAICEQFQPDIVLTDIRMPRMNGVDFAFHLRKKYPHCKIVFMSVYADKEYLKAAISLKAVNYVEKPIDIEELEEALRSAIAIYREEKRHLDNDTVVHENKSYIKQEAALQLTRGEFDAELWHNRLLKAGFEVPLNAPAVTIIAKLISPEPSKALIESLLDQALTLQETAYLFALKDDHHVVLHLFSRNRSFIDHTSVHSVCYELASLFKPQFSLFAIAAGDIVTHANQLQQSYTSAVLRLQAAFFQKPCSIVLQDRFGSSAHAQHYQPPSELLHRFQETLVEEKFEETAQILEFITTEIRQHHGTLLVSVKELYYRFLLDMDKFAASRNIVLFHVSEKSNVPWQLIMECHFLDDIHLVTLQKLNELKQATEERSNGAVSSNISRIIRYIHQHYMDDDLSVQEVSDHMQMTASHLISIFKGATGKTIKQYVTEYRMEKAKELLRNKRLKVIDVASQMGFKDGEHFAKSFRKYTGMTPSDYRERCQS